jgi:hypothetical protein
MSRQRSGYSFAAGESAPAGEEELRGCLGYLPSRVRHRAGSRVHPGRPGQPGLRTGHRPNPDPEPAAIRWQARRQVTASLTEVAGEDRQKARRDLERRLGHVSGRRNGIFAPSKGVARRSAVVTAWRSRVIDAYAQGSALYDAMSVAGSPGALDAGDAVARWSDIPRRRRVRRAAR